MQPCHLATPPLTTPIVAVYLPRLHLFTFRNIVSDMNISQWLDNLIGSDARGTAANKAGYAPSTISRQLERGHLRPETVIALCRAYDRSPITGLIETGYIHAHEVDAPEVAAALNRATNQQLLDEVVRRSDPEARYLFGEDEETIGLADDADVFELPSDNVQAGGYAANRRKAEPEEGDDDYGPGA